MANLNPPPKALFFDVFGTCVDWRKSVTKALWTAASERLETSSDAMDARVRKTAGDMTYETWGEIAQEWRNTYLKFTREIANDPSIPYKTVDQHHLDALQELLTQKGLVLPRTDGEPPSKAGSDGSLFDENQIVELSLVWHRLDPWPDTCAGLRALNRQFATCTLSNGNLTLLQDMVGHGGMPFTHVFSAEMFQSYKPSPKVYLGAAAKLGLRPEECMMVAAHLDDLKAARECGFKALYVERSQEERHPELLDEGIPHVWVKESEEGFVTAAKRLGVDVTG